MNPLGNCIIQAERAIVNSLWKLILLPRCFIHYFSYICTPNLAKWGFLTREKTELEQLLDYANDITISTQRADFQG